MLPTFQKMDMYIVLLVSASFSYFKEEDRERDRRGGSQETNFRALITESEDPLKPPSERIGNGIEVK